MITRIHTETELNEWRDHQLNKTVGFVATMGALHSGHMALIAAAKQKCDVVIASIFVNPAQFDEAHDLAQYPRTIDTDVAMLEAHGADAVFVPDATEIYPSTFKARVLIDGLTDALCGSSRPGHFDGVATIITILLNMIRPSISFFGEKDAQQLLVLQRLQQDLRLPGTVEGVATARADDGLALSSRNFNLDETQRKIAPVLQKTLQYIDSEISQGKEIQDIIRRGEALIIEAGVDSIDYLEIRTEQSLKLIEHRDYLAEPARLFIAARLGKTRLIDNIRITR